MWPGLFCGLGYIADTKEPCVLCGAPTGVHARCGAARTGWCDPAATLTRPWAAPAAARTSARTARQAARLQVDTAKVDADEAVSMLDALEKEYAPRRRGDDNRMRLPFWSPDQPPAMFDTYMPNGWSWARPFEGPTVTLDRVGAWVAAASSVEVAHGALTHTGDAPFAGRPGIYQVQIYPWYEQDRLPSPLGNRQDTVWVAAPMVKLLAELAEQGRWADATVLDSYTGDPCKIDKWARYANTLRCHAAAVHGRGSLGYDLVKQRYAQAINMMDGPRRWGTAGMEDPGPAAGLEGCHPDPGHCNAVAAGR
jgi:hypothetical protein